MFGSGATMDAKRLRDTLEMLGPTFVKFGQLLSLRRDIFSNACIEELTRLQDQVPADSQTEPRARPVGIGAAHFLGPDHGAHPYYGTQPRAPASCIRFA